MTALAEGLAQAYGYEAGAARLLTAEILPDLASAEALWRLVESGPAPLGTPYQRLDWVQAFARSGADRGALRVLAIRDAGGQPRLLMPLSVAREGCVTVARGFGGGHANFHMPLFASREAAAVSADDLAAAMIRAGRAACIDVFVLSHQPVTWDGAVNPLAQCGERAASDAYGLMLGPDPESTLKRVFSADARKKLRSKEKRLAEAVGPLEYRRASGEAGIRAILDAFHAQKSARFASLGVPDPYAKPAVRRFLAEAVEGGAMELHALVVRESGRVLATFGGAVDAGRYSGMMTSFDADASVARYSPGDLLLFHLVREQAERGRRAFDLGVGEARYKASICDETIEMVRAVVPVTMRGHLFGLASLARTRAKRRIKASPWMVSLVRRVRGTGALRLLTA
ncbi:MULTISPECIES: GNAT family N-acetyltransferase [Methylobacterium]|nr:MULTISPECIES: GNAT family N-acetyltransferase [Methylobacterium]PIU06497.1 MAG: GNAT family N-acetyltransferase [Methylobacterium sp. CG09_land_8_20_14_0_10_71_15]PIU16418.1 MAG: GNAT family N-acetyltransferase [Methylobacterium sp. CG08_land_8_20_14_0_20_71_15]GBU16454.1 hypothetical protein AwMethylo_06690 [Methylobacterium sp.]